jgi:hypothetical protein
VCVAHARNSQAEAIALQQDAQVIDFRDLVARKLRDLGAAVGRDGDEAFGLEQPQRIAHRNPAHGKARGQVFLPQQRSGLRLARENFCAQRRCDRLRCGSLTLAQASC